MKALRAKGAFSNLSDALCATGHKRVAFEGNVRSGRRLTSEGSQWTPKAANAGRSSLTAK